MRDRSNREPQRTKPLLILQHHSNFLTFLSILSYSAGVLWRGQQISLEMLRDSWRITKWKQRNIQDYDMHGWWDNLDRLEVYKHNFTMIYPLGCKGIHRGDNLYLVPPEQKPWLSVPHVELQPILQDPLFPPSIAIMISLAKHYRKQWYWSKYIIFLIMEHELVGLQSWLDSWPIIWKPHH